MHISFSQKRVTANAMLRPGESKNGVLMSICVSLLLLQMMNHRWVSDFERYDWIEYFSCDQNGFYLRKYLLENLSCRAIRAIYWIGRKSIQ